MRIKNTFLASFSAVSVSAAQDVIEITAPSTSRVLVHMVELGQYSDSGDAEAEALSIKFLRGHTSSGSGGSSVTPAVLNPYGAAASSAVEANNTTGASGGTPETLYSAAFNIQNGHIWRAAAPPWPIMLKPSQRFVVSITAPADGLTMNGSVLFEEIGHAPVS